MKDLTQTKAIIIIGILILCLTAVSVYGTTPSNVILGEDASLNTWMGSTSSDWSTASNWNQNYVPNRTTPVILNGSATYQPFLSNDSYAYNVTFTDTTGELHLNGYNMWVNDTVQFHTSRVGGYINATGNLTFRGIAPPGTTHRYGRIQADSSYYSKDIYVMFRDVANNGLYNSGYIDTEILLNGGISNRVYLTTDGYPNIPTSYPLFGIYQGSGYWLNMTNATVCYYNSTGGNYIYNTKRWFENVIFQNRSASSAYDLYWWAGTTYSYNNVTNPDGTIIFRSFNTISYNVPFINFTKSSGSKMYLYSSYLEFINSTFYQPYVPATGYTGTIISKDHAGVSNDYRIWVSDVYTKTSQRATSALTTSYQPDSEDSVTIMSGTTATDYITSNINLDSSWNIANLTLNTPTATSRTSVTTDTYVKDKIFINNTELNVTSGSLLNASEIDILTGTLYFDDGIGNFSINGTEQTFNAYKTQHLNVVTIPTDPSGYTNLSKYVNVTNTSADSWLLLNLTYNASDATTTNPVILRYDGSAWQSTGSTNESGLVYVNTTAFSLFGLFDMDVTAGFYQCYYDNSTGVNITNGITVNLGENLRCNDTEIYMNDVATGWGYVSNYGNFTLENVDMIFNVSWAGNGYLYNYANMTINNTNITSILLSGGNDYWISDDSQGMMIINNSYISYAGWDDIDWTRGIEVNSPHSIIENNTITLNAFGVYLNQTDAIIKDNYIDSSSIAGLTLYYVSDSVKINNNTITTSGLYDIYTLTSTNNTMSNITYDISLAYFENSGLRISDNNKVANQIYFFGNFTLPTETFDGKDIYIYEDSKVWIESETVLFNNSNITFNPATNGLAYLRAYDSVLKIDYTNITSSNTRYPTMFIYNTSFNLTNSEISKLGYQTSLYNYGITLVNVSYPFVYNNSLHDNYFIFNLYNTTNGLFYRNVFADNRDIYVSENSYYNNFTHNTFNGHLDCGLVCNYASHNIYEFNNVDLEGAGTSLIEIDVGTNNSVINNYMINSANHGIQINSANGTYVYNNTVFNSYHGIYGTSAENSTIINNNITGSTNGIYLSTNSDNNIFNNNTITNSSSYDYYEDGMLTGTYNTIYNMTVNQTEFSAKTNNIAIKEEPNPPAKDDGQSFLTITGTWIDLNLTYTGITNADIWKYNTEWNEDWGTDYGTYVNKNISSFSTFGIFSRGFYHCWYSNDTGENITSGITVALGENLRCNDTSIFTETACEIYNYGNLTFDLINLTFNATTDGDSFIWSNGTLTVNTSNMTSQSATGDNWLMGSYNASTVVMNYSHIQQSGWNAFETYNSGIISLDGGQINVSYSTIDNNYGGLYINSSNAFIQHNNITSNTDHAIWMQGSDNNTIYNNTMDDSGTGVLALDCESNNLTGNTMSYNTGGVYLGAGAYNNFTNNTMNWNSDYGILLISYANWNRFENTTIQHNGDGVGVNDYGIYTVFLCNDNYFDETYIMNNTHYDIASVDSRRWIFNNTHINQTNASFTGYRYYLKQAFDSEIINTTGLLKLDYSYLNITNGSTNAWIELNLSYDESKSIIENRVKLYKHNTTSWIQFPSTLYPLLNYVYYNITGFSNFALLEDSLEPNITNTDISTSTGLCHLSTVYPGSWNYKFNITITDNYYISDVIFQLNSTNYSFISNEIVNVSDVFTWNSSTINSGYWEYKWYVNDTSNNWNETTLTSYTILGCPGWYPPEGGSGSGVEIGVGDTYVPIGKNFTVYPKNVSYDLKTGKYSFNGNFWINTTQFGDFMFKSNSSWIDIPMIETIKTNTSVHEFTINIPEIAKGEYVEYINITYMNQTEQFVIYLSINDSVLKPITQEIISTLDKDVQIGIKTFKMWQIVIFFGLIICIWVLWAISKRRKKRKYEEYNRRRWQ